MRSAASHARESSLDAMGAYLSQPITDKESSDGEDDKFKYGTTAMQGWRTNMEVGVISAVFPFLAHLFVTLSSGPSWRRAAPGGTQRERGRKLGKKKCCERFP